VEFSLYIVVLEAHPATTTVLRISEKPTRTGHPQTGRLGTALFDPDPVKSTGDFR